MRKFLLAAFAVAVIVPAVDAGPIRRWIEHRKGGGCSGGEGGGAEAMGCQGGQGGMQAYSTGCQGGQGGMQYIPTAPQRMPVPVPMPSAQPAPMPSAQPVAPAVQIVPMPAQTSYVQTTTTCTTSVAATATDCASGDCGQVARRGLFRRR